MKKLKLFIPKQEINTNILSLKLHGFLMAQVDSDYSKKLHHNETNPYSSYVQNTFDGYIWVVTLLTYEAISKCYSWLLALKTIPLDGLTSPILIKNIDVEELTQESLLETFQEETSEQQFTINFLTPTSFKSQGEYIIFPSIRFIFQSLMQKYSRLIDNSDFDEELLTYLCRQSRISKYDLKTHYYQVHSSKVPAFRGRVTIKVVGASTMKSYIKMLLTFAEYSGIGIKTSLGMGGVRFEQR